MSDGERAGTPGAGCAAPVRRRLLCAGVAAGLGTLLPPLVAVAADDASRQPAAVGDQLAFASWDEDTGLLAPAAIALDAAPRLVYPRDPVSGVVRENSRLNQIVVVKLDPARMSEASRARAIDGVLAYSGVCTHAACGVTEWNAERRHLICPCHASEYDPAQDAARVTGPAPRPLPALPLRREGDTLVIAGPFSAPLGAPAA